MTNFPFLALGIAIVATGLAVALIVAWAKRAADKLTVEPDTGEYHD